MIDRLLERAATRFVFVVGKGGVGKSTTACALALACADRSDTTHLISTDPAHSLADIFQQNLSALPTTARCSNNLTLEEFNARNYAEEFFRELRAPLIDLIERGTYLDTSDATGFLDLSIPGIDEVMSALRLVDLDHGKVERIVVDTAPTGHTMRLLEAAQTIRSWVVAGRAMAEKAGTVAAAMAGRPVPAAAEPLLERLETQAARFEQILQRESCALVVTRRGEVVASETAALVAFLEQHRIAIAARIGSGPTEAVDFTAPASVRAIGCEGLRTWSEMLATTDGAHDNVLPAPAPAPRSPAAMEWITSLRPRLLLVAGKGGVGKSTCAAAIAATMSARQRVCVVSTDPAGSLAQVFAHAVRDDVIEVAPNLFACQVDAAREFGTMRERYQDQVRTVLGRVGLDSTLRLDRAVIESLWNFAPPGIDELIAVLEILERSHDFDALVIDSAPTGHFLRLMELPGIALDWVHALLRMLVKYNALGSLDALARDLLAFAKQLRQLQLDLRTPERAAVFVVTLDEPVVAAETARLNAAIIVSGLPLTAIISNRIAAGAALPSGTRSLVAPEMRHEIVGVAALKAFVEQWELRGE